MADKGINKNDIQEVKSEFRKVSFSPLMELLIRVGFGARGLLYVVMGMVALSVALGGSSAPADQQGALAELARLPSGKILLILMIIGLVGYSVWGLIRATFDPLHLGKQLKGLVQRAGYLVSGISYFTLVFPTIHLLSGQGKAAQNGAQTAQAQQSASTFMTTAGGHWLVAIIGIVIMGVGVAQFYIGISRRFDRQFQLYDVDYGNKKWIRPVGRVGTVARAVVFFIIGLFMTLAAYHSNPHQAVGMDGALLKLARLPYGPWLLGFVASGLIAFGLYSLAGAVWVRFKHQGK